MAKNQLSFFATQRDLELLLRALESKQQLQFAMTGLFDSPTVVVMQSLLAASNFGHLNVGDASQATGYLIAGQSVSIDARPVPQHRGGVKHAVDQLGNPTTVAFRPGGSFGERCLIAGQVGTASKNPSSLELFNTVSREVQHQFTKIRSYYVGTEASCWTKDGD